MKTTIAIFLACSLCLTGRAQDFEDPLGLCSIGFCSLATPHPNAKLDVVGNTQETFELLSTKGHDTDFSLTECFVAISVTAAGLTIAVWLRDFCRKRFGTNQPAMTNTHQVIRSENLTDWKLVGKMTWDDAKETWDYRETNSMSEPFHFYRITNYFGQ